jgi:hypothetical protein
MPRAKAPSGDSISARIKAIYRNDVELLRARDNDGLKAAWEKSNPGERFSDKIRQIAANIKSRMRKDMGIRKRRSRGKVAVMAVDAPKPIKLTLLAPLEEHVDECLMLARGAGREQLAEVIKHLKRARNKLIMMIGDREPVGV